MSKNKLIDTIRDEMKRTPAPPKTLADMNIGTLQVAYGDAVDRSDHKMAAAVQAELDRRKKLLEPIPDRPWGAHKADMGKLASLGEPRGHYISEVKIVDPTKGEEQQLISVDRKRKTDEIGEALKKAFGKPFKGFGDNSKLVIPEGDLHEEVQVQNARGIVAVDRADGPGLFGVDVWETDGLPKFDAIVSLAALLGMSPDSVRAAAEVIAKGPTRRLVEIKTSVANPYFEKAKEKRLRTILKTPLADDLCRKMQRGWTPRPPHVAEPTCGDRLGDLTHAYPLATWSLDSGTSFMGDVAGLVIEVAYKKKEDCWTSRMKQLDVMRTMRAATGNTHLTAVRNLFKRSPAKELAPLFGWKG